MKEDRAKKYERLAKELKELAILLELIDKKEVDIIYGQVRKEYDDGL